jgi:phosphoglycerate dehydrogenase-like enzyme
MRLAYLMKNEADLKKIVPMQDDYIKISMQEDKSWDPDDLKMLHDREGILVWKETVTEDVIEAAPQVKIVQRLGVGYDELKACFGITRNRGIPCCNIEGVNREAVGEHNMLLILSIARQLIPMHEHAKNARWPRSLSLDNPAFELMGKTLGIVGLGNTGTELAKRAKAFGMNIIYNDIREIDHETVDSLEAEYFEKVDLYKQADVISINTDLNPTTANLITERELSQMKKSSILICCARGGIIDQAALRDALNSDQLFGAGIDVFEPEPLQPDNPLLSAKNIVLTPHIAGITGDSLSRHYQWAYENVKRVLEYGQEPLWVVNGI